MSQSAVESKSRDSKLIENPIRFSQSKLWDLQKNYFNTMGIQAWEKAGLPLVRGSTKD